jgi:hypothetical protein
MKLTKQSLKRIIKEELEAVLEGSKTYISPDIQAALEKRKRLLDHPHPKIRELASSTKPDGTPKTLEQEVGDYKQAESLADALGDY